MTFLNIYKSRILSTAIFALLALLLFPYGVSAQTTYTPLINIPGLDSSRDYSLPEYINRLYLLLIALGAIVGVIRISFAGMKYSLSDIVTSKEEAKEDIKGVLFGLVLLLIPFVVLNTIYPGLTNLDVLRNAPQINGGSGGGANNANSTSGSSSQAGMVAKTCYPQETGTSRAGTKNYDTSACASECATLGGTLSGINYSMGTMVCTHTPRDTSSQSSLQDAQNATVQDQQNTSPLGERFPCDPNQTKEQCQTSCRGGSVIEETNSSGTGFVCITNENL